MRHTDDRYTQERRAMDVALRMIQFEARTSTITTCTGLSEDRIRKLFNAYVVPDCNGSIRRRRGKSPQQIACFTESARAQFAASVLAGVLVSCDLLNPLRFRHSGATELGAILCDAYEFYRELDAAKEFSFEHAWFLLRSLRDGNDLILTHCARCSGLMLRERWAMRSDSCVLCRAKPMYRVVRA